MGSLGRRIRITPSTVVAIVLSFGACTNERSVSDGDTVSILAGRPNGAGNLDGIGPLSRFSQPSYLIDDGAGSIFVTDQSGIRKIDKTTREVTTAAGITYATAFGAIVGHVCNDLPEFFADGPSADARFSNPAGIASDGAGHVYIADSCNHSIRRLEVASGWTSTIKISNGSIALGQPVGLAFDTSGHLFVTDLKNLTVFELAPDSGVLTALAGTPQVSGSADGVGSASSFRAPRALVSDGKGALYLTDRCAVRRIVISSGAVTTIAGQVDQCGSIDGVGTSARFGGDGSGNVPGLFGIAYDGVDSLYVADADATVRQVAISSGTVTTVVGSHNVGGSADGAAATFASPTGIVVDGHTLYVADTGNTAVRTVDLTSKTVATPFGISPISATGSDGKSDAVRFVLPQGIALDGSGNVYVVDSGTANSGNTIRKIDRSTGEVTTVAGTFGKVGSADGVGALARFNSPSSIVFDGSGALYVTDTDNSTIRKVDLTTNEVTTIAGAAGQAAVGSGDGAGVAARFAFPMGLTYDHAGHLYIVDGQNFTIRELDLASAVVTTIAGSPGVPGHDDGVGSGARFSYPSAITYVDGALYVSDDFVTVRKVDIGSRTVTTLAGLANTRGGSADGVGANASFNFVRGLATDGLGNLYVADQPDQGNVPLGGGTIRKIALATAAVTTLIGVPGELGVRPGSLSSARLNRPLGLAFFGNQLFISDGLEGLVLEVDLGSRASE